MQAAEFHAGDQDLGFGIGKHRIVRGGQRVEGGVATHESYVQAMNVGREIEPLDQGGIQTGGEEAGAGGGDEIG